MGKVREEMSDPIYCPKMPCPHDLGKWFCDDCESAALNESVYAGYPVILIEGCHKVWDGKVCGATHLGYLWCDVCKKDKKYNSHFGEFAIVGYVNGAREVREGG